MLLLVYVLECLLDELLSPLVNIFTYTAYIVLFITLLFKPLSLYNNV